MYWWDWPSVAGTEWEARALTAALQASLDRDPWDAIVLVTLHSEQDGGHFGAECWCQPLVLKQPFPAAA